MDHILLKAIRASSLLFLCGLLFLLTSCANGTKPPLSDPGRSMTGTTHEIAKSTVQASSADKKDVEIPMENVPDKYWKADKASLKPKDATDPDSSNVEYEDENGTVYEFDKKSGEYRGFFALSQIDEDAGDPNAIPMEKLKKCADEIASHFIDVSKYERTYFYQEGTSTHKFQYYRPVGGLRSSDIGDVWLSTKGKVILASFIDTGIYDELHVPSVDVSSLDQKFYRSLSEQITCDKIWERTLVLKDNELYVAYDFNYTETKNGEDIVGRDVVYVKLQA